MKEINCDLTYFIHRRYYTRFFSGEGSAGALDILSETLKSGDRWIENISTWQDKLLGDGGLPDWFKSAAFNELYYIADGGTQWLEVNKEEVKGIDTQFAFTVLFRITVTVELFFPVSSCQLRPLTIPAPCSVASSTSSLTNTGSTTRTMSTSTHPLLWRRYSQA